MKGVFPSMAECPGVRGTLHLCRDRHEEEGEGDASCQHVSTFVNTGDAGYLEDNDIRGFLDGSFNWGWNQAGQAKVRIGRLKAPIRPPAYGEDELFRTLQRWDGITLPPGSRLTETRLVLFRKTSVTSKRPIYLYSVHRDWNPGKGGIRGDNVSVPNEGEVWWGDARYGRESWGLPGAGFAARGHADADTEAEPLAVAECGMETSKVEFGGERLRSYVERRVNEAEPLLFLLKLSDREEDEPGSMIAIHSAEYGHERHPGYRPRLHLEWEPGAEISCTREEVFLEFGRHRILPPVEVPGASRLWVEFCPEQGFESPTLGYREIRSHGGEAVAEGKWKPIEGPVSSDTGWIQLRVLASRNPVVLGSQYRTSLRDTWVVSAPPEDQKVSWRFLSPSGKRHDVDAEYDGDFCWRVEFTPDEIGRWHVRWRHEFSETVESGPGETFDVVPTDLANVRDHIQRLTRRATGMPRAGSGRERALTHFMRLERGAMQALDPGQYRSARGRRVKEELRRAREELWGRPVPEEIPMESHPLRTEVDGRTLDEPIPENDEYFRHEDYGEGEKWWESTFRALRSLCRRTVRAARRRLPSPLDGLERSGCTSSGEENR